MSTSALSMKKMLGSSPFWAGLCLWTLGALTCLGAWELSKVSPVYGPIALGLSSFVNMFCFFRGLNKFRRAGARRLTLFRAQRLGLTPDWGSGEADFMLVDEAQGLLIGNGRLRHFADIAALRCRSNFMAHRLQLFMHNRDPQQSFDIGLPNQKTLHATAMRLRDAIARATGTAPVVSVMDITTSEKGETSSEEYILGDN